jgi:hypothetical protein
MASESDTDPDLLKDAQDAERRRALRQPLTIPARVDTKSRPQRFAMTRNLSKTGALLATPSRFHIGERATLRFRTPDSSDYRRVEARIVRLELNPQDQVGIWPYLAAVRFAEPLEDVLLDEPIAV